MLLWQRRNGAEYRRVSERAERGLDGRERQQCRCVEHGGRLQEVELVVHASRRCTAQERERLIACRARRAVRTVAVRQCQR